MKQVTIYTDGACSNNPGPGGWGAILIYEGLKKEISGYEEQTTNNRMEMLSVIKALELLKEPCIVNLYSDSQYVCKGISSWLSGWKKKNWIGSNKEPIKNQDLWQTLDSLLQRHVVTTNWVKGHSGDHYNEIVDELARMAILRNRNV